MVSLKFAGNNNHLRRLSQNSETKKGHQSYAKFHHLCLKKKTLETLAIKGKGIQLQFQ